ncbi:MAG: carbohydrate kinase [Lachnospiraceae bacterium]|nr:carbohydrate kinase [Lachnospiraceae bacterium]
MKKTIDVIALGELLIDFTENGESEQGNIIMEANPGGAPCNVLAMLENLKKTTAFIGKVGKDHFGLLLKETIEDIGINTENLIVDNTAHTTLAFVHTKEDGDREFSFYRNPGADMLLKKCEVNTNLIVSSKIFHFGTLSFTSECAKEATCYAIECAKKTDTIISFDPNIRKPLWDDLENAKKAMDYGMRNCNILKISDDELLFYTNTSNYDEAVSTLIRTYNIPLICLTLGKKGSIAYYNGMKVFVKSYVQSDTIETTGAGDTFMGCILNYVLEKGLYGLTRNEIEEMLTFANAGASIITTRRGALKVMPSRLEITNLLLDNKNKQYKVYD